MKMQRNLFKIECLLERTKQQLYRIIRNADKNIVYRFQL